MHVVGSDVHRGEVADEVRIVSTTVRKLRRAGGRPRARYVFVEHELQKSAIRRDDRVSDGVSPRATQPCALLFRDARWKRGERSVEHAICRIVDDVTFDRHLVSFEYDRRERHSDPKSLAHQLDVLFEEEERRIQSRDVVFVVVHRRQRHPAREARESDVKPGVGIDRQEMTLEFMILHRIRELPAEHVVVDAVFGAQRVPIDRIESRERTRVVLGTTLLMLLSDTRKAIVHGMHTHRGREKRVGLEPVLPNFVEEPVKLGVLSEARRRNGQDEKHGFHDSSRHAAILPPIDARLTRQ